MTEVGRRWTSRIIATFVLWLLVVAGATYFGNHPRPLLLALGIAAFATVMWLYLDASAEHEVPQWDRGVDDPVREPGEDPRLALLARIIAQHLDSREVGDTLRAHLKLEEVVVHPADRDLDEDCRWQWREQLVRL